MRSLAVCSADFAAVDPLNPSLGVLDVGTTRVRCAIVHKDAPSFDATDPANAHKVLVHVRAFSCNYRDRAQVLKMATVPDRLAYYVLGSEFAGTVAAAGAAVSRVAVGARVMGDNSWPMRAPVGWRRGVPTNHASREYLILHEEKVSPVPPQMSDEHASAFSIGAQTAYSMVAKLDLHAGARVLVTAATSNTSLFTIHALRRRGVHVYATTSSHEAADRLRATGVSGVFPLANHAGEFAAHPDIAAFVSVTGGFDAVVDPFFDLYLRRALPVIACGGRYVTCGFADQHRPAGGPSSAAAFDCMEALEIAMLRNITIIGNCAGLRQHLQHATDDYVDERLPVVVDAVFSEGNTAPFLDRTFNARDRFGKVVYRYE